MNLKLEIISKPLTTEQKEAISEKLQEISLIVKGKSRDEKISEYFSKLRYESEIEKEQWLVKQFVRRHPLQKQNETSSQINLYDEHKHEKEFLTRSEDFLCGQVPQNERQKARLNATLEDLKEECKLLGEALGKGFYLGCKCSQQLKNPQLLVSMTFLSQVANFQRLVNSYLNDYQNTKHNKI
ncbi:MAG: hypothetical protein Q4A00_05745 [Flavobacteriaceae bacterium]|nr:hypothetical protein [Flavobacteriaceae bacterium]